MAKWEVTRREKPGQRRISLKGQTALGKSCMWHWSAEQALCGGGPGYDKVRGAWDIDGPECWSKYLGIYPEGNGGPDSVMFSSQGPTHCLPCMRVIFLKA